VSRAGGRRNQAIIAERLAAACGPAPPANPHYWIRPERRLRNDGSPAGGHAKSLLVNRLVGMPTGRTAAIRLFHGGFDRQGKRGR